MQSYCLSWATSNHIPSTPNPDTQRENSPPPKQKQNRMLEEELQRSVAASDFEQAAHLRDRLRTLVQTPNPEPSTLSSAPQAQAQVSSNPGPCSGSEAGSYLRLIDFVYHSTLGLRVIKKKKKKKKKTVDQSGQPGRVNHLVSGG